MGKAEVTRGERAALIAAVVAREPAYLAGPPDITFWEPVSDEAAGVNPPQTT